MKSLSVREMIIETQLQVRRLGGNRREALLDEKMVWRLNTAQDRIIKDAIRPDPTSARFLINQIANSEIQRIISPNVSLTAFKDTSWRSYAYLPPDFAYLINDRTNVLTDCTNGFDDPITDVNYQLFIVSFPDSQLAEGPYYKNINIKLGETITPFNTAGAPTINAKFEFVEYIQKRFQDLSPSDTPYTVYWESFDKYYYNNAFILVGQVGIPTPSLNIDGIEADVKPLVITRRPYTPVGDEVPNRSIKGDFLYDVVSHNYYDAPSPRSPIAQLADNKLFVFSSKRFLATGLIIDYIRKPRRISLYLNQACELDGSVHEKVCSVAAELILSNVEAPSYQNKVQENLTRT